MYFNHKIVWITGASSGIGEALAYAFVQAGATVILSARRVAELDRVKTACGEKQDQVHIAPLDLTQQDDMPDFVASWVEKLGRIDILVNNGGISQRALTTETDLSVDRRIMEVNYFGQIAFTKAVLPYMVTQGSGQIAVISSLTGKFGFPLRSAYAASKHALHGFFETLYLEMYDQGIRVTLVNPGRIRTNISLNALTKDGSPHGEMDPGQEKGMPVDVCARKILSALRKQKVEIQVGGFDTIMVYFKRYMPWLFRYIAKRIDAK
ncbi:MAG: SDR family oxidoreductase [Bacteroidota bacterium]